MNGAVPGLRAVRMDDRVRRALAEAGVDSLLPAQAHGAAMGFRHRQLPDEDDPRYLHPGRTLLVLIQDFGERDPECLAAGALFESRDVRLRVSREEAGKSGVDAGVLSRVDELPIVDWRPDATDGWGLEGADERGLDGGDERDPEGADGRGPEGGDERDPEGADEPDPEGADGRGLDVGDDRGPARDPGPSAAPPTDVLDDAELVEALVTADPWILRMVLAEALDHLRHAHLWADPAARRRAASLGGEVMEPLARRIGGTPARRYAWWVRRVAPAL